MIETNHSISTSNLAHPVDHCPSLNLSSSNPDRVWVRSLFLSTYFCRSELVFPKCTASRFKIPKKEKIESFKTFLANDGAVKLFLAISVYSFILNVILFLLIASATQSIRTLSHDCSDLPTNSDAPQPWPASGLPSAPDWRQSVTYAGILVEYAVFVCVCLSLN